MPKGSGYPSEKHVRHDSCSCTPSVTTSSKLKKTGAEWSRFSKVATVCGSALEVA